MMDSSFVWAVASGLVHWPSAAGNSFRAIYIFTIIMIATYRNRTLRMTLTNLAVLVRAPFIFTTFAYVARQLVLTR